MTQAEPIRVLIVDDSLTLREQLAEFLEDDGRFLIVGKASNGREAIHQFMLCAPDVVVLDLLMPVLDGLQTTEWIMANHPTPILICSASMNRSEVYRTFDALRRGAVDVVEKPIHQPSEEFARLFCDSVALVSRIQVITRRRFRESATDSHEPPSLSLVDPTPPLFSPPSSPMVSPVIEPPQRTMPRSPGEPPPPVSVVAVGVSTGGPRALVELIKGLGPDFDTPVLVVLHLDASFGWSFPEWINQHVPLDVRFATEGARLDRGVWLAPPGSHMMLREGRLVLDEGPERNFCRPSVDVLFESLAIEMGDRCVAALLTGMGRDGAQGLRALQQAGASTIAQDEASSIVFGMPRAAIALNAADEILTLADIAPRISELITTRRRRRHNS